MKILRTLYYTPYGINLIDAFINEDDSLQKYRIYGIDDGIVTRVLLEESNINEDIEKMIFSIFSINLKIP